MYWRNMPAVNIPDCEDKEPFGNGNNRGRGKTMKKVGIYYGKNKEK